MGHAQMGVRAAGPPSPADRLDLSWEVVFSWYGPDGSMVDVTAYGDTALAHLNRAGARVGNSSG